jgi:hypothetical protein
MAALNRYDSSLDRDRSNYLRICLLIMWAFTALFTPLERYAALPREFFHPAGVLGIVPTESWHFVLTRTVLTSIRFAVIVSCLGNVLFKSNSPTVTLITMFTILLFETVTRSFGAFIGHERVSMLVLCIALLSDNLWRSAYPRVQNGSSERQNGADKSITFTACMVIFLVPYSLTGLHRLAIGGFEMFAGEALANYIALRTESHNAFGNTIGLAILDHPALISLANAGFFFVTVLEIFSLCTIAFRWFRQVWVVCMLSFHMMAFLLMNILFWENIVLIVVILSPLGEWVHHRHRLGLGQARPVSS